MGSNDAQKQAIRRNRRRALEARDRGITAAVGHVQTAAQTAEDAFGAVIAQLAGAGQIGFASASPSAEYALQGPTATSLLNKEITSLRGQIDELQAETPDVVQPIDSDDPAGSGPTAGSAFWLRGRQKNLDDLTRRYNQLTAVSDAAQFDVSPLNASGINRISLANLELNYQNQLTDLTNQIFEGFKSLTDQADTFTDQVAALEEQARNEMTQRIVKGMMLLAGAVALPVVGGAAGKMLAGVFGAGAAVAGE